MRKPTTQRSAKRILLMGSYSILKVQQHFHFPRIVPPWHDCWARRIHQGFHMFKESSNLHYSQSHGMKVMPTADICRSLSPTHGIIINKYFYLPTSKRQWSYKRGRDPSKSIKYIWISLIIPPKSALPFAMSKSPAVTNLSMLALPPFQKVKMSCTLHFKG